MVRKAAGKSKSEENGGLPEWAENEIKFANFQEYDTINRTGYFLDINEQKKRPIFNYMRHCQTVGP